MGNDLAAFAKENGVKYFMISYTVLFGGQRAKLVPAQAIADMQKDGAGFAGFATWLDLTPAHPDMLAVPDPASVIQLPWKPDVAWVAANCIMDDKEVDQAPRNTLKRLVAEAASDGMHVKTGVEAEFFLISPDGKTISDEYDTASKPCYDQQAVMRRYDVIAEICDHMLALGWGAYQNDHEDANGQFEMNWAFDDALATADKHSFFKFMVKSIAEKHGLRATFMPKPFQGLTGNGCHALISVWDKAGKTNVFADNSMELGLSAKGKNFLGGIMKHASALAAITTSSTGTAFRSATTVTLSAPRMRKSSSRSPATFRRHSTWRRVTTTEFSRAGMSVRSISEMTFFQAAGPFSEAMWPTVTMAAGLEARSVRTMVTGSAAETGPPSNSSASRRNRMARPQQCESPPVPPTGCETES